MYRYLRYTLFIAALLLTNEVFGQYVERIRSARPSRVPAPWGIGQGVIQIQTGLDFASIDNGTNTSDHTLFPFLLRIGTSEKVDLRFASFYRNERFGENEPGARSGVQDLFFGARVNFRDGSGLSPTLGVQAQYHFYTILGKDFERNNTGFDIILLAHQSFGGGASLVSNVGTIFNGNNSEPAWRYGFRFGQNLGAMWALTSDHIGVLVDGNYQYEIALGIAYFVSNDVKLDASLSFSDGDSNVSALVGSVGISWRSAVWRK